jgi:hypothetical protein
MTTAQTSPIQRIIQNNPAMVSALHEHAQQGVAA